MVHQEVLLLCCTINNINLIQVIGIHKESDKLKKINIGTFIWEIFKEININLLKNEIICIYNKQEDEISLFHDYTDLYKWSDKYKIYYIEGKKNINGDNVEIYINNKKIQFNYKYKSNERGEIKVKFKFKKLLTSTFCMFDGCYSLISIDLSSFNTTNITNMRSMFKRCSSLISLDLSSFNTTNVNDIAGMFYNCESLVSIDLSSFKTTNINDMSWMFYKCSSLKSIDLSSFDTTNVNNMDSMFCECYSLETIDLSSFNTINVNNVHDMFLGCSSLKKEKVIINKSESKILSQLNENLKNN